MFVLFGQAAERVSLQCIILCVLDAAFDLAFVFRSVRLRRQDGRSIVSCKGLQLRMNLRIVPVRLLHGGFQIIDHQSFRHASKIVQSVLDALLDRFTPNGPVIFHETNFLRKKKLYAGFTPRVIWVQWDG